MHKEIRDLARGGLFLALGILFQQLRFFVPLPPVLLTVVIGTLVNATLLLMGRFTAGALALAGTFALPCVAALQGHIHEALIPVVFAGNSIYVLMTGCPEKKARLYAAPFVKALVMGFGVYLVLGGVLGMPYPLVAAAFKALVPVQVVTGFLGIKTADILLRRIHKSW